MLKRFISFYNRVILYIIAFGCLMTALYGMTTENPQMGAMAYAVVVMTVLGLFTNENMWRNLKYIRTGKSEHVDNTFLSFDNTTMALKAARLRKDVPLFIPNRDTGRYFYFDDGFNKSV